MCITCLWEIRERQGRALLRLAWTAMCVGRRIFYACVVAACFVGTTSLMQRCCPSMLRGFQLHACRPPAEANRHALVEVQRLAAKVEQGPLRLRPELDNYQEDMKRINKAIEVLLHR